MGRRGERRGSGGKGRVEGRGVGLIPRRSVG